MVSFTAGRRSLPLPSVSAGSPALLCRSAGPTSCFSYLWRTLCPPLLLPLGIIDCEVSCSGNTIPAPAPNTQ